MDTDEGFLFLSEQAVVENPIAFGSNVPRKMFPLHTAPDRMGIEMGLRGAPERGPGVHQPHPISFFLYQLNLRPRSKVGWYFGGRTSLRSTFNKGNSNPAPPDYQKILLAHPYQSGSPFGKICTRFSSKQYHTLAPGPGRYDNHADVKQEIEFHHAFGGKKKLKETARMKCTKGIPEKCGVCDTVQVGDYYEYREMDELLCSECFYKLRNSKDPMREAKIMGFSKVRDCSSIHKHEFPGYPPKLIIKSEKETQKLKQKEAYFRKYFSE